VSDEKVSQNFDYYVESGRVESQTIMQYNSIIIIIIIITIISLTAVNR
jgi:hypothetical protein